MKKKSGQISLMVIIGVIILIIILIFFFTRSKENKEEIRVDAEEIKTFAPVKEKVETYVEDCIKITVRDILDNLWLIEAEDIETYVNTYLDKCIDDFNDIELEGFNIKHDDHNQTVEINEGKIKVKVNFPIEITRNDQKTKLNFFDYELEYTIKDDKAIIFDTEYIIDDDKLLNFVAIDDFEMTHENILYKTMILTDPLIRVYIVKINLNDKDLRFLVTPYQKGLQRTSDFLTQHGLSYAINGGGWPTDGTYVTNADASGTTASMSDLYVFNDPWVTVFLSEKNEVTMGEKPKEQEIYNAVTGFNIIVKDGDINDRVKDKNHPNHKLGYDLLEPRTSIGYDENNNIMIWIVVDGRQPGFSNGINLYDLAELQIAEGATQAFNMDGGGSSTLVVAGQGVVNSPSDGGERSVANHLGIYGEMYDYKTIEVDS
jgi:hypothetical protein